MANELVKTWAYTDLTVHNALYLEVNGVRFKIAQFTMTFAKNEIPQAQCLVAVGRHTSTLGEPPADVLGFFGNPADEAAEVHRHVEQLKQMQDAKVVFRPKGEYAPDGTPWPDGETIIFEGVLSGFGFRKLLGKVHALVSISHWLIKLTFSSCLVRNGHVSSPSQYNAAAVLAATTLDGSTTSATLGMLAPAAATFDNVATDLWLTFKRMFLTLASFRTAPAGTADLSCFINNAGAAPAGAVNDRALAALERIEPFNADPALNILPPNSYVYGAPLRLTRVANPALPGAFAEIPNQVKEAILRSVAADTTDGLSGLTFWDKIVAGICANYDMAVIPMVASALVIADVPAYRGYWKDILVEEYDSLDQISTLDLPLRAVAVHTGYDNRTGGAEPGASVSERGRPLVGGCYVAQNTDDPVSAETGMVLYVNAPPWLRSLGALGDHLITPGQLAATTTTPVAPVPAANDITNDVSALYGAYAHSVYLKNSLRGRGGTFGGKLRFDIAPGSNVRIRTAAEKFIQGDALAVPLYGNVSRVTIQINAEAPAAGTAYQITHLRTEKENAATALRTSTDRHPLFDLNSIHGNKRHGSPLVPKYDI